MRDEARETVYAAIDQERAYQDLKWNITTTPTKGEHTVTEFLVYMQDYVNEALHHLSRNADPEASETALHGVRKVAALAVSCMEQNGVRTKIEELEQQKAAIDAKIAEAKTKLEQT